LHVPSALRIAPPLDGPPEPLRVRTRNPYGIHAG